MILCTIISLNFLRITQIISNLNRFAPSLLPQETVAYFATFFFNCCTYNAARYPSIHPCRVKIGKISLHMVVRLCTNTKPQVESGVRFGKLCTRISIVKTYPLIKARSLVVHVKSFKITWYLRD